MSYRELGQVAAFRRLAAASFGSRLGSAMFEIAVVLFAVDDLHRSEIAGVIVLLANLPGLVLSPVSGGFLAGRNVTVWMTVDCLVKAAGIAIIALAGSGTPAGLAVMAVLATAISLTSAFGNVALRSYIALLLEPRLRPRANAVDSMTAGVAVLFGPVIAAFAVSWLGGRRGLLCVAAVYLLAAIETFLAGPVRPEGDSSPGLRNPLAQVRSLAANPTLRGLTATYMSYQAAIGVLVVALPVLVSDTFRAGSGWVGICWSVAGGVGIVSSLLAGRVKGGRETVLMFCGMGVTVAAVALLFTQGWLIALLLAFGLLGVGVGPIDVGLLGLRQSVLPDQGATALLAVSSAVNIAGYPLGAFIGGLIAASGSRGMVTGSLVLAAAGLVASGLLLKGGTRTEMKEMREEVTAA